MSPERLRLVEPPVEGTGPAAIETSDGTTVSYVVTGAIKPVNKPDTWDINRLAFAPVPEPEVLSPAQSAIHDLEKVIDSYSATTDRLVRTHIDEANYHSGQLARLRIEDTTTTAKKAELTDRAITLQARVYEAQDKERIARTERDEAQTDHDALSDQKQKVFVVLHSMLDQCNRTGRSDSEIDAINAELRAFGNKILQITETSSDGDISEVKKLQQKLLVARKHLDKRLRFHEASEWALNAADEDLHDTFGEMEELKAKVIKTSQIHHKQTRNVQKGGKHARREPEARKRLAQAPLIRWLAVRLLPQSPVELENSQTIRLAEVER